MTAIAQTFLSRLKPEQIERIKAQWLKRTPYAIAQSFKPYVQAHIVKEAARELGLPPYPYKRAGDYQRKPRGVVVVEVREVPGGMLEIAPGHVMTPESFELFRAAVEGGRQGARL